MEEIIKYLKNNFFSYEIIDNYFINIELPFLTLGGDYINLELYKQGDVYLLSDNGACINSVENITSNIESKLIKDTKNKILKDEAIIKFSEKNNDFKLYIEKIPLEDLPFSILYLLEKSKLFSEELHSSIIKNKNHIKTINLEIEDRLKFRFKGNDFKERVKKNYKVVGESNKKYKILFMVKENYGMRLIESILDNNNNIAQVYMKYSDIGKQKEIKRDIVYNNIEEIESSSLNLLKKVSEDIIDIKKFA